jgi:hypothetical protein
MWTDRTGFGQSNPLVAGHHALDASIAMCRVCAKTEYSRATTVETVPEVSIREMNIDAVPNPPEYHSDPNHRFLSVAMSLTRLLPR